MKTYTSVTVVLVTLAALAYIDTLNWGNVNHTFGFVTAAIIIGALSLWVWNPWPIFLYSAIWNPLIATVNDLPFFYMGETAWLDIQLKSLFGNGAGGVWFWMMILGLTISLLFALAKHQEQKLKSY